MREAGDSVRQVRHFGQVILLAAAYFTAAKASLYLAIPPGYATAVWPPSGIALAALLLLGNRVWPGVWLGAALINLTVASSPFAAVAIGTGNTLEALAAATLIRRHIAEAAPFFDRVRNIVQFVAFAAVCSTVGATIGVGSLALAGSVPWPEIAVNWVTWWHGDMAGIIIVTPLVLTWSVRQEIAWTREKAAEAGALALSLIAVAFLAFGNGNPYQPSLPLTFLILPFIVWAAFRFTRREVTTANAAVCAIAVWYTAGQQGPFAIGPLNLSLLLLLAFISTVVVTGLMLSAAVNERSRAMAKLADAMQELRQQARTDPLTGLANRRDMWEFLQREWLRARRRTGSLAVVMIDLDHFKRVNDTFGHDAGDLVLTGIAALLGSHIRGSDIASRFGGEEFALVLPDVTADAVLRRVEAIREAIERLAPAHRGRQLGRITASFGVALYPDHAADPESLLRAADQALYDAKHAGRNRVMMSASRPAQARPPLMSIVV